MSEEVITPTILESDGIVYGIASACVRAVREVAEAATAERFIHLAARQVAQAGLPVTSGSVAAHLHTTLTALTATIEELRQVTHENTETQPETDISRA